MNDAILKVFADRVLKNQVCMLKDEGIVDIIAEEARKRRETEMDSDGFVDITTENYRTVLLDPEIRSIFRSAYLTRDKAFDYIDSILFLLPVSESGYNFGQFRLASHLVSLGIPENKIHIFPLYLVDNLYHYNKEELVQILSTLRPTFICETAYLGWERNLYEINKLIHEHSCASILMGGPLTSSHLLFCVKKMEADVVFVGHGEFLLEEYLRCVGEQKCLTPILDIDCVFYKDQCNSKCSPYVNKYLDLLHWDMPLLKRFCEISPVINLFTSDVCYGNCVFCYRTSVRESRFMSQKNLLKRLKEIVNYMPLRELGVKYIRFYDDDFFAAPARKVDCLRDIWNVIKDHYKLYELQFSIRSIGMIKPEEIIVVMNEFGLERVTIGVDGFCNEDLAYLQKGYDIDRVFATITMLSTRGISCLLYSILTTFVTTYRTLNESLINMIRLVSLGQVYIGPSITPVISVSSNNKKLYPQFIGEHFCYLQIHSVNDSLKEGEQPENIVMQAALLPKDRIVRLFIQKHDTITQLQSAYIIPLVADFYQLLAREYNWLCHSQRNRAKCCAELQSEACRLRAIERELQNALYSGNDSQETISNINNLNDIRRMIHDNSDKHLIVSSQETINLRLQDIRSLINDYVNFFDAYFDIENAQQFSPELYLCVRRLLSIPIHAFNAVVETVPDEFFSAYKHVLMADFVLTEEELEMFECLQEDD